MAKIAMKSKRRRKTTAGKVKKVKDPNAPKRALSAYVLRQGGTHANILKHPNFSVTDVARELGVRWKTIKDKSKYEKEAAKDKAHTKRRRRAQGQVIVIVDDSIDP